MSRIETCPDCQYPVFWVIPGVTTEPEIISFQQSVGMTEGEPGWLHPGAYCTNCDWSVMVEFPLPSPEGSTHGVIVLTGEPREPLRVAAILRDALGCSNRTALDLARSGRGDFVSGEYWRLGSLLEKLAQAGASVHLERRGPNTARAALPPRDGGG